MPFRSQKQRRKFAAMVRTGEISRQTFEEWNRDTPLHLPEKVDKPRKRRRRG